MTERQPEERGINLQHESIEALLMECYEDLFVTMDEGCAALPRGEAFINQQAELNFPNLSYYTDLVADVIAGDRACDESRRAGYLAFHFANTVSAMILSADSKLYIDDFFGDENEEQLRDKLLLSVGEYLGERPTLDWLISRYTYEVDPSGRYGDVAEVVAGSTFMFIDAYEREMAIQAETEAFAAELAAL